jgi:hypothetical protein
MGAFNLTNELCYLELALRLGVGQGWALRLEDEVPKAKPIGAS